MVYITFCYGQLYRKINNYEEAIRYFDNTLKSCIQGSDMYFASVYNKCMCNINAREFPNAKIILENVKKVCGTHELWSIYFKTLEYFLTLSCQMTSKNDEAVEYIESVSIPHYLKHYDYSFALECYRLLEQHFMQTRRKKRSWGMTKLILDVYIRGFTNNEEVFK